MAKLSDYNMKWVKRIEGLKTTWILQFGNSKFEDLEYIIIIVIEGNKVTINYEEAGIKDNTAKFDTLKEITRYIKDIKKYWGNQILKMEEY
jgi:hypothetical protein